jgi:hypothetical protein
MRIAIALKWSLAEARQWWTIDGDTGKVVLGERFAGFQDLDVLSPCLSIHFTASSIE